MVHNECCRLQNSIIVVSEQLKIGEVYITLYIALEIYKFTLKLIDSKTLVSSEIFLQWQNILSSLLRRNKLTSDFSVPD